MITDSKNFDAAKKLKADDVRFTSANIVKVDTVDALIAELRNPVTVPRLILALDGDKNGAIEVDGVPLDLKDLTGVKMVVKDGIFLEGTSIKPFSGAATLKAKLIPAGNTSGVTDEWVVLELPQIAVVVDDNDEKTHEVASTKGPGRLMHFVTVQETAKKGVPGSKVVLHAKLVSANTAKNLKELKSHHTTQTTTCLTGFKTSDSPLNQDKLGALQPRTTGELDALGYVDWIITIKPPEIISDADRPDLEHQKKQKVPGENVVPDPFFGWELATDEREFIKKVTPTGKQVVLTGKTDPEGMYRWPNGDAEGLSTADEQNKDYEDPYTTKPFHGWPSRWELAFKDSDGDPGEIRGFHRQGRVFERVQLDTTWYRCSDIKRYRLKASAKKLPSGEWEQEPNTEPLLELNNKKW
jgi:hypothetical protein